MPGCTWVAFDEGEAVAGVGEPPEPAGVCAFANGVSAANTATVRRMGNVRRILIPIRAMPIFCPDRVMYLGRSAFGKNIGAH